VGTEGGTRYVGVGTKSVSAYGDGLNNTPIESIDKGRWPANLIHDGSEEVLGLFPESSGGAFPRAHGASGFVTPEERGIRVELGDEGSAARFFYCAKADKAERGKGNNHPTVKPLALMSYLCKLLASPGFSGVLLDPFMGSGSTLLAASR